MRTHDKENNKVNLVTAGNITIHLTSEISELVTKPNPYADYFLYWACTVWGSWEPARDGTCREFLRPKVNGRDAIGSLPERKRNSICISGVVKILNYQNNENITWPIDSDCEAVQVRSIIFQIENGFDYLTVNGQKYTGNDRINIIVPQIFLIQFTSDGTVTDTGFVLRWSCK